MQPRIENMKEMKFIGKRIQMSFSKNKTFELWRSFMPRRKEIMNSIGSNLYSIEIYTPQFFEHFNPETEFEKWAAVEVTDYNTVPVDMATITAPAGLYAVFSYKGVASAVSQTYQYILGTWLPKSDFLLDNRPHLAVMGEKYKNDDPDSEEELWTPIKPKTIPE